MKKINKLIAVILSVTVLMLSFTLFSTSASAVTYSVSDIAGKKGEMVTIFVKINSSVDIWGANVVLEYDSSQLEYVSCSSGSAVSNGSLNHTDSSIRFSGTYASMNDTVFSVNFRILKDDGKSLLTLRSTENIDYNANLYSCTTKNGAVVVLNSTTLLGDVTGDNDVTTRDARTVLQYSTASKIPTDKQSALADINKDGEITTLDARRTLQIATGLY